VTTEDPRLVSPVFVVGPLRSGTTLLRLMLTHHPRINCFGEFECSVSEARGDSWPELADYYRWTETDWMFSGENLVIDKSLSYPDLVRSFLAQEAARSDKEIISAAVHSRFDLLPKLWPHARFIHTLRDPRDVASSTMSMGWSGHPFFGASYWLEAERRWDKLVSTVPARQLAEVRYEDLVRHPEAELAQLCQFLGLAYDPAMLTYDQDSTYSKPDPSLAEQWRRKLTVREIQLVEAACGDLLQRRGYPRSGNQPATPKPIELMALRATNRFKMTSWAIKRYGLSLWTRRFVSKRVGPPSWTQKVRLELNEVDLRNIK